MKTRIAMVLAVATVAVCAQADTRIADLFPDVSTWKFYEEADDEYGLNLAAWEEWDETEVAFWMGEGISMAIPVDGNLSASDVVLVAGTYSDYGRAQVVSDEWMFAKHCTALEKAIGYDPYEDCEYDQGA